MGVLMLTGCTSRWQDAYVSTGVAAPELAPGTPVVVREITWDRMNATLSELQADRTKSDVHPDDWSAEQKEAARLKLLRGLQVQGDADVLGRSEFKSTEPDRGRASERELSEFAAKVGANRVVWASRFVGQTDVVKQEQAQVNQWRETRYRDANGAWRSSPYYDSTTIYVPVVVRADEYAFVAYFLRDR